MVPYRPFLLPLLTPDSVPGPNGKELQQADSPLAEERMLESISDDGEAIWRQLKVAAQARYGLPLMTEHSGAGRARPPRGQPPARSPNRCLVLENGNSAWFLIEQPAAIPLIDRFAEADQTAAIARPTLFARLWREYELMAEEAQNGPLDGIVESEDTARALESHIGRLIGAGMPSDWHLEPARDHYRSRLRIDGRLQAVEILPHAKGRWLLNSMIALAGLKERPGQALEGRLLHKSPDGDDIPMRISLVPAQLGPSMVVRFLYPGKNRHLSLQSIGFPEELYLSLSRRYRKGEGLWLVVGPTGSGKSTTLNAFLKQSVQVKEKVLTIEDPVEYTLQGVHHLSLGSPPGLTWARAVRAFLRQAPDCVLIGEIRDEETAAIALQAARTGHRILSTLHARDNAGVRRRFADLGQDPDSLDSVCEQVLHQRLVPLLCRHCAQQAPFPSQWVEPLEASGLACPQSMASAGGCDLCRSGCSGRQAVFSSGELGSHDTVRSELRSAVWRHFKMQRISLAATIPYLPATVRSRFGICQV
jgi:type II secretory ATPase GspE/PulE/Tfp pilus assembly ATPase PilB-like protein